MMKCPYRMIVQKRMIPSITGQIAPMMEQRIEWPPCFQDQCPFYKNIARDEGRAGILDHCEAAAAKMPMFAGIMRRSPIAKEEEGKK